MKLIHTLSVISKEEWFSLRKYILMKCREDSDSFKLFTLLQKIKSKLHEPKTLTKIKSKHFGLQPKKYFLNLQSRLYQWVEEWMVYYDTQNDYYQHELQLVKSLNNRGLYKQATQIAEKVEKKILDSTFVNHDHEKHLVTLYHIQYYSNNPIKSNRPTLLQELTNTYFKTTKGQLYIYLTELYNWGNISRVNHDRETEIANNITSYLPSSKSSSLLKNMKEMFVDEDINSYFALENSLHSGVFEKESEMHILIVNYLLAKTGKFLNQNKLTSPQKTVDLYDYALHSKALMTGGKISTIRFINIVSALSFNGEKETIIRFIEKWHYSVSCENTESIKTLALAILAFYKENYMDIILLLRNFSSETISDRFRAQNLLTIAYYEHIDSYYETLTIHIENYKRQLKRNKEKMSNKSYTQATNLLTIIQKMTIAKYKNISIDINDYPIILYRSWVTKKLKAVK